MEMNSVEESEKFNIDGDDYPIRFKLKKSAIYVAVLIIIVLVAIAIVCVWGLTEKPDEVNPVVAYTFMISVSVFLFFLAVSSMIDLWRRPVNLEVYEDFMICFTLRGNTRRIDYSDISSIDKTIDGNCVLKTSHDSLELSNEYTDHEKLSDLLEKYVRPVFRKTCLEKLEDGQTFICGFPFMSVATVILICLGILMGVLGVYQLLYSDLPGNEDMVFYGIIICGFGLSFLGLLVFVTMYRQYRLKKDQIEVKMAFSSRKYLWGNMSDIELGYAFNDEEKKTFTAVGLTAADGTKICCVAHMKNFEVFRIIAESKVRPGAKTEDANMVEPGTDEDAHKRKYDLAAKWFGVLKWISAGICLWAFAWPEPYKELVWILTILPVMNALFAIYFSDVLEGPADIVKARVWWNLAACFLLPSLLLAWLAFSHWNILRIGEICLPVGTVTFILAGLIVLYIKDLREKPVRSILTMIPFAFLYAYGTVVNFNCMYDKTDPELHHMVLKDKRESKGDSKSHYFKFGPGELWNREKEISISKSVYEKHKKGDMVNVEVRLGKFGITWYRVK